MHLLILAWVMHVAVLRRLVHRLSRIDVAVVAGDALLGAALAGFLFLTLQV